MMAILLLALIVGIIFLGIQVTDLKSDKKAGQTPEPPAERSAYVPPIEGRDSVPRQIVPPAVGYRPEPSPVRYDAPSPGGDAPEDGSFEKLLGKNVIGVIAAVLIFIGIIAFGALIFPIMSDAAKVALIFALSFAISGIGVCLFQRNNNPFSNSVLGCGFGCVFVSIFVTQLYFSMISDDLAYLLILLWIGATYRVSQILRTRTLLYLSHLGCLISLLMIIPALIITHSNGDKMFVEGTIYLIISSSLLILMDYLSIQSNRDFPPLLFKISLYVSMGFCLIWLFVPERYPSLLPQLPFPAFLAVKAVIWLDAFALWLLSHRQTKEAGETLLSHALYALTLISLSMTLTESALPYSWNGCADLVGVAFLLVAALLSYVPLRLFLRKGEEWILDSAILTFFVTMLVGLLLYRPMYNDGELTALLSYFLSAFVLWMYYSGRKPFYFYAGSLGLAFNYLFTMEEIVAYAHFVPPTLLSLLLLACLTALSCRKKAGIAPFLWFFALDTLMFPALLELFEPLSSRIPIAACIVAVLNIIGYLCLNRMEKSGGLSEVATCLIYILESIVFIVYSVELALEAGGWRYSDFGLGVLAMLVLVMGIISITKLDRSPNAMLGIWYAVKLTWLTLYPMYVLTLSLDERMILSVTGMLVALVCIVLGLRYHIKAMRIYGLSLTILSVLKLVIVDVWSENSIVRVGALIAGGIICFAISAVYNRIEQMSANAGAPESSDNNQGNAG